MAITTSVDPTNVHAVIVVPSVCDFYFTSHRFSSLGAHILYNLLLKNKIRVTLHNFPLQRLSGKVIDLPKEIAYLHDHIIPSEKGKLSYFTQYQRFGDSPEECAAIICKSSPNICFISSFAFSYSYDAIALAKNIKLIDPAIPIVFGGAGPSAYPDYFIRDPNIDFVIAGEAEVSIEPFINAFIYESIEYKDVPNLYYKNESICFLRNRLKKDTLCASSVEIHAPELKLFSESDQIATLISKVYETKKSIFYSTSITRGCSKTCRFCSNFITHGNTFRTIPLHKMRDTVASFSSIENREKKRIYVNFEDDNLLLDAEYFINILKIFKQSNAEISFFAENGLDYSLLTPELLYSLIHFGMIKFNLTIASINRDIAEMESRVLLLNQYKNVVATLARENISCITYFICGFKNDTKDTIAKTLAFLADNPTTIGISLFYPVPGIQGFENLKYFDRFPPYCYNGTSAYPWNSSLPTSSLITAFRLSRYINLLKQKEHSTMESKIINKIREEKKLFTFIKTANGPEIVAVKNTDDELVEKTLALLNKKEYI